VPGPVPVSLLVERVFVEINEVVQLLDFYFADIYWRRFLPEGIVRKEALRGSRASGNQQHESCR
jgi:hypothetical protein